MPTVASGLNALAWLVVIAASIPLALWAYKRSQLGRGATLPNLMRLVAVLPLSPTQRLVTVEVGRGPERRWLVLGVTGQQIATLHTLTPDGGEPVAESQQPFQQLLASLKPWRGENPERK